MRIADHFPDPAFDPAPDAAGPQTLVLAGGCFWCTEGVFRNVPGVTDVVSGYAGGSTATANYRDVSEGATNHAEVVAVTYDPAQTSMGQVLKAFFWLAHDPTQRNRQGNDVGTQYRSAVFYADPDQHVLAQRYIDQLNASGVFDAPIATTLEPLDRFYPAEEYHQNYAALNPAQGYIRAVARPKMDKAMEVYGKTRMSAAS